MVRERANEERNLGKERVREGANEGREGGIMRKKEWWG